jgi:hypothetical protein
MMDKSGRFLYFYMFSGTVFFIAHAQPKVGVSIFGQGPHSILCSGLRKQGVKLTRDGTPTGLNYSAIFIVRAYIYSYLQI